MISLLFELKFCFNNPKIALLEIEGCYSIKSINIFQLFIQIIICFITKSSQSNLIPPILMLLSKLTLIYKQIHNYDFNSWYNLQIANFVISYILVLIANQFWNDLVLIHILLLSLLKCLRLQKLQIESFKNNFQNINFFQYWRFQNREFKSNFKDYSLFIEKISGNNFSKYEDYLIKEGQFEDRFLIINQIYQFSKIQQYLYLININKEKLNWLQQAKLEANLMNTLQSSKKITNSSLCVRLFVKTLDLEQQYYQILINLIDLKSQFYNSLIKEQAIYQYLQIFRNRFNKIIQALQKFKDLFEKEYDLDLGKMKNFKSFDFISTNIITLFSYIFYGNYFKSKELEKKQNELSAQEKIMNVKLQRNEAFLISTSAIRDTNKIINPKNKRLIKILEQEQEPKYITDILPQFQKIVYKNFVNEYLQGGIGLKQPYSLYFLKNNYLMECDLFINSELSKDDIELQNFLILKNQPNHFLLFDIEGKILGISEDIYIYLIQKSENPFTKVLQIQEFIKYGMIQYYLPEIYKHIQDLAEQISSVSSQQILNIQSRWDFPINHKKCLNSTLNLINQSEEHTHKSIKKKQFYPQSWKKQQSQIVDENISIQNVLIKIMQKQLTQQIQNLVVPSSRMKSIEFEGTLEFIRFQCKEVDVSYFLLRFKQIEDYQQDKSQKIFEQTLFYKQLNIDELEYEGLQLEYELIERQIKKKTLNNPLKYNIIILFFMIITTTLALIISYTLNQQQKIYYQNLVNFLAIPQALTYHIGAAFILMWNQYCIQNKLYQTSPYLEQRREDKIIELFKFWNQNHEEYTKNISIKCEELGYNNLNLIYFENNIKNQFEIDYYSFYAIIRESMVRQFKNTNFNYSNTFDPGILQTNGLVRQNMLQIYKFHNYVLDEIIELTQQSFYQFQNKTFLVCLYSSIIILLFLVMFIIINCSLLKKQARLIRLLQYLNLKIIYDQIETLAAQKEILQKFLLIQNIQKTNPLTSQQNEKVPLIQSKLNPLSKIDNYDEKYHLLLILSLIIGVELIFFIFGSQFIAELNNNQYENSLILAMKYLNLKSRLDSTIIIGEVIKTEHLMKNNTNIELINQTEHILFFFNNIDDITNLSNNINDQLITVSSYNSSFQQKLIDVFNDDLCLHYQSLLNFCNIDNIKNQYYENENYLTLIDKGIYGIVQDLNKLAKQDYNYEFVNLRYQYNQSHSDYFLTLPIHNHLFQQYFIEIETSIYLSFLDIFSETQTLSEKLSNQILIYLITSSIVFFFLTSFIAGFWIHKQYKRCNQLKLIATLFPPALIKQNSFYKLLNSKLKQIQ
ncbi:unnamed protein product [Paramecium sonneborni]|uniref:Transmembrane protein n=1 Tax=Paramecium sonneborni TaxID=65129 RepID=A0A8S1QVN3_9CILI|nr:unnamed protein product [Paramecium sonneborni]